MNRTYNRAYKFRLLPTKEQEIMFAKIFGCVRFIWNKMLEYAMNYYNEHKKSGYSTPAQYKSEFPWLKEVDSLALANVQLNLKKGYQAFFEERAQAPKFKSKHGSKQSYTTNNQEASQAIRLHDGNLRLPKVGFVKLIQHRPIKDGEKIKTCTISKSASGKYYVSIMVEGAAPVQHIKPRTEKIVGLDFSMTSLYVSSMGEIANYPRYYRMAEERLRILSRNVSRKKKGSKNRRKARLRLARWHEHIAYMRSDFLHKLSYALANTYDAVIVESLNMQAMSQALHFGKSVADNGWGRFLTFLEYKLIDRGKQLVRIDKWFPSSKKCSQCGTIKEALSLSERLYDCAMCGHIQDRDLNAALNIRTAGMAGIAW